MNFDESDKSRYDCSCGKFVDECEFYRAAAAHMRLADDTGWDPRLFVQAPSFSRNAIVRHLLRSSWYESALRDRCISAVATYRAARDRFLDAQLQFFDNAMRISGASIYLDGTKSIRRAQLLARSDKCEMKVLHLIRDGRGYCASYLKADSTGNPSLRDAASAWLRYIEWVDGFSRSFPAIPTFMVRYEDLCRATTETIGAICGFLEIPHQEGKDGVVDDIHILGNSMRRNFNGVIREDTSWKTTFDQRTQAAMTSMMKKPLERFGYI